jgi:hypothetical protein
MNVDGSGQRKLLNNPEADDSFPAWATDGFLLFSRYGCLLWLNSADGSEWPISAGSCAGADSGQFPDWIGS